MPRCRLLLILIALVAMAAIGGDLGSQANPGHRYARTIAQGFKAAARLDFDAALDERLSGDADKAGYRWAEHHGLDQAGACQALTPAFRAGCGASVRDQAP